MGFHKKVIQSQHSTDDVWFMTLENKTREKTNLHDANQHNKEVKMKSMEEKLWHSVGSNILSTCFGSSQDL